MVSSFVERVRVQLHKILFSAVLVSLCGCGGSNAIPLVGVTGKVTYQGKAVSGATVTMISEKGQISNGFTDNDGNFRMTTGGRAGVPVGNAKVGITKMTASTATVDLKQMKPEDMRSQQMSGGGVAKDLTPKSEIPKKYADPEKSLLVATIDRDSSKNVFEYPLVE